MEPIPEARGGKLIVSETTWLSAMRPPEIQSYWDAEYPEIDVASAKSAILERHGRSDKAKALVEAEKDEFALYEKHSAYYRYGVFVARRLEAS